MTISSFNLQNNKVKVALLYFYVNPDGSRGNQVLDLHDCEGPVPKICMAKYDTVTMLPTGNIVRGERP